MAHSAHLPTQDYSQPSTLPVLLPYGLKAPFSKRGTFTLSLCFLLIHREENSRYRARRNVQRLSVDPHPALSVVFLYSGSGRLGSPNLQTVGIQPGWAAPMGRGWRRGWSQTPPQRRRRACVLAWACGWPPGFWAARPRPRPRTSAYPTR